MLRALVIGVVAAVAVACVAPQPVATPTSLPSSSLAKSPTPTPVATVAPSPASQQDAATAARFADPRRGWVGAAGGIYGTTDGASWQLEYVEGYTLGSVFTPTPSRPQLGTYPSILGSFGPDGWWFITCTPPVDVQSYLVVDATGLTVAKGDVKTRGCSRDAQVIDERHVVAVSLKSVIATEDGGVTWKTIFSGPTP